MNDITKDKITETLETIAEDMQNDARNFDGQPFNGKTVAEYFGNHGAAIAALANIIKTLLPDTGGNIEDCTSQKQEPTETHTVTNVDLARELLKAVDKTADNMLDIATNPYSTCTTGTQIGMTIARVKLLDAIEPIRKQIEEA